MPRNSQAISLLSNTMVPHLCAPMHSPPPQPSMFMRVPSMGRSPSRIFCVQVDTQTQSLPCLHMKNISLVYYDF